MLSERSRTQEATYMIPFAEDVHNKQIHRQKTDQQLTGAGEKGEHRVTTGGCGVSFCDDKSVLKLGSDLIYLIQTIPKLAASYIFRE